MKQISLRVTSEVNSYVEFLATELICSRQESIRRCIIYCSTCPDKVRDYTIKRLLYGPKEVKNEKIQT